MHFLSTDAFEWRVKTGIKLVKARSRIDRLFEQETGDAELGCLYEYRVFCHLWSRRAHVCVCVCVLTV